MDKLIQVRAMRSIGKLHLLQKLDYTLNPKEVAGDARGDDTKSGSRTSKWSVYPVKAENTPQEPKIGTGAYFRLSLGIRSKSRI